MMYVEQCPSCRAEAVTTKIELKVCGNGHTISRLYWAGWNDGFRAASKSDQHKDEDGAL